DHDTVEKKDSQINGADKNGAQVNDDVGDEDEEDTANLMSGDLFFDGESHSCRGKRSVKEEWFNRYLKVEVVCLTIEVKMWSRHLSGTQHIDCHSNVI
ncbi:hypothetical protein BGZ65_008793, partial [Modicella reniformis]